MKLSDCEMWDSGRVTVHSQFAETLRANSLTQFEDFLHDDLGDVAKNLLRERQTFRLELTDSQGQPREYFLKRHLAVPWKEYVKQLLRLTRPIIGAHNEWNAIHDFHRHGIPTMTPVAFGQSGRRSFLLTQGITGCRKLSEWMHTHLGNGHSPNDAELERIVDELADVARTMHSAGLHHQDFYLGHLLLPIDDRSRGIHVIDLGRARRRRRLSSRWIVKDLAQLNYSATLFPQWARDRFLERYFDRPLRSADRGLIRRIDRKTARIARHGKKHNQ